MYSGLELKSKKKYLYSVSAAFVIFGVIVPLLSLNFLPVPFFWAALSWVFVCISAIKVSSKDSWKIVWINLCAIFFALGIFEAFFWIRAEPPPQSRYESTYTRGYFDKKENDILGYSPTKNHVGASKLYHEDELVYDVVYTIDPNGLRISSPLKEQESKKCLLFFGGSFTFGEGVNDDQTMPYQVSRKTHGIYRVYNFGFHGYGPHQMLSALEHGLVEGIVECVPQYAIFQALVSHVSRSAGLASWDQHGPKYILGKDGQVHYVGSFDQNRLIPPGLSEYLQKSLVYEKILGSQRPINADDINLFVGIVDKARKIFETRYPGSEFHVLLWNETMDEHYKKVLVGLKESSLRLHKISDILPRLKEEESIYILHLQDRHPNAMANKIIADFVVNNILM